MINELHLLQHTKRKLLVQRRHHHQHTKDSIIVKMNLAAVSSSSFTTGVRIASGARGARVASSFSLLSSSHA